MALDVCDANAYFDGQGTPRVASSLDMAVWLDQASPVAPFDVVDDTDDDHVVLAKYDRAVKLVASIFNKYYNGSHRAVDTDVIQSLLQQEDTLFSLQCLVDQGPAAICRERKESEVRLITTHATPQPAVSWMPALCGGIVGSSNTIMRKWDNLGEMSKQDAMKAYVACLNSCLPHWDDQPEYPIALEDRFWKDDFAVTTCAACHVEFTMQNRRHHCRMCLDIFCHACSSHMIMIQLSRGAPPRLLRLCTSCKNAIDNDKSLQEVRQLAKANREIKAQIEALVKDTDVRLQAKLAREATLRSEALSKGCNMVQLDQLIESKIAAPTSNEVKTPLAHKFQPSESVEAVEQLRVANRQLVLCLKVAETRAKKAQERVEITITVLEEAIKNQSVRWHAIAARVMPYLTVVDLHRLAQTKRGFQAYVASHDLLRTTCIRRSFPLEFRPQYWMWRACSDMDTHKYLCDLAQALTAQVNDSREYDSDEALHWASIMLKSTPVWSEAYALVLDKCGEIGALEHDKQINADVQRTFGRPSLRKQTRKSETNGNVEEKKDALVRVLRAFTATHTEMGYCQGMNFLAAFLLANVQWNEAQAFWLFVATAVSPQYELMDMYRPGVPMLNLRFYQLDTLVKQLLPDLHAHFEAEDFHVSMCASGWFMTLFTNCDTLPPDAVVRVIDCFLVYGWVIIFRVALALLKYLQPEILKVTFEEIVDIFYKLDDSALILHPEYLVHAANAIPVTDVILQELQTSYENEFPGTLFPPRECGNKDELVPHMPKSPPKGKPSTAAEPAAASTAPPLYGLLSFLPLAPSTATDALDLDASPDVICKQS
ncbi:unnamed protein product [Aphanomyces euteiches]